MSEYSKEISKMALFLFLNIYCLCPLLSSIFKAEPNLQFLEGISIVGVKQIEYVTQAVEETLKGNCVRFLSLRKPNSNVLLPKIRKNKFIEVSKNYINKCFKNAYRKSKAG